MVPRFIIASAASVVLAHSAATQTPAAPERPAAVWQIDKTHSDLSFQIRHFMSKVRGTFGEWQGSIVADPDAWQNATIDVSIKTASVNTGNDSRDKDLRSNNHFAADSFPQITFKSTRIERQGDAAKIYGDLTIRGITKPVVLDGRLLGLMKSAQGRDRVGFEASVTVNRLDFNVKWNRAVEGGGLMLGDEVKIEMNIEAVRTPN